MFTLSDCLHWTACGYAHLPAPYHVMLPREDKTNTLICKNFDHSKKKICIINTWYWIGSSNCINCLFHNICKRNSSEWEENFKHLPFVTEACNLGESILIFIEHTDNKTLCCILNLVTKLLWQHTQLIKRSLLLPCLLFFNHCSSCVTYLLISPLTLHLSLYLSSRSRPVSIKILSRKSCS